MRLRAVSGCMVGLLIVAATGCLSPRGDGAAGHTYQLRLEEGPPSASTADPAGPVVLVNVAQSEPGFETPRIVYVTKPYELEYFSTSQWADSPARLFTASLTRALTAGGFWRAAVPLPSTIRGDYRVDTAGVAIRQEFIRRPSQVRMTVQGQFVDLKDSKILGTRTFEAVEPASSDDAYGGVVAANRAMAALLAEMTAWAQGCAKRAPECHR